MDESYLRKGGICVLGGKNIMGGGRGVVLVYFVFYRDLVLFVCK